jgi:tRNA-2-methylthio-N6-dimethylallyladenosine synthase
VDDVSEEEKARRLAELFEVAEPHRRRHLEGLVGSTAQVLVEQRTAEGACKGRTEQNAIVHFGCVDDPVGEMVSVRILRAFKNSLEAELLDPVRARPLPERRTPGRNRRVLPVFPSMSSH